MSDNKKKILEMLEKNKISAEEAYRLLSAVDAGENGHDNTGHSNEGRRDEGKKGLEGKFKGKYLRVTVTPPEGGTEGKGNLFQDGNVGRVNVRIPMSLIRAGLKLTALIPPDALDKANNALREKGVNFDVRDIKPETLEELIEALGDMEVDVEGAKGEKVKVYVE
jgi:SHOCT-like domain